MEKYIVVGAVVVVLILIVVYTQMTSYASQGGKSLLESIKKEFPKYMITEKSDNIVINQLNPRNELEELIVIRTDPEQKKNIRQFGQRITLTYPKQPSIKEIKKDVAPYLKK